EGHQVDDQGGAEEDGDHLQQAPRDVPEHGVLFRQSRRGGPAARAYDSGNRAMPVPAVAMGSADHLVIWWYSGTVSQPYSTSETRVEQPPMVFWHHSGTTGRSRMSGASASCHRAIASSSESAARPSASSWSNSGFL